MNHLLATLSLILFSRVVLAQASWAPQAEDQIKLKLGVALPKYNFSVITPEGDSNAIANFEPNAPSKTFLNFSYRNLGATLGLVNTNSNGDNENKGSTSGVDFQFRFYGKKSYEFFYQFYQGYFLENSSALDPAYSGLSKKILYPDLETQNYGVNFTYSIDDESFSQSVAFDQNGYQEVSDWGRSWFLHVSQSKISNPSGSFIPAAALSRFGSLSDLNDVRRTTVAAGFGIGGTAVYKRYYASAMISAGPGYQNAHLRQFDGDSDDKDDIGTYSSLKLGAGYNGLRHVMGMQVLGETVGTRVSEGELAGSLLEFNIFYAYRFEASLPPLDWASSLLDSKPQ